MKKHRLLKWFVSLTLAASLTAGFCSFASAEEWYPGHSLNWNYATSTTVTVKWYNDNIDLINSALGKNVNAGLNYWASSFSSFKLSRVYTSSSTAGVVILKLPSQSWWNATAPDDYSAENGTGLTHIFNMNGSRIANAADAANANGKIRNAIIYFNPNSNAAAYGYFTDVNYRCTIAHELGHALGFGHVTNGTPSIMFQGRKFYTSLQSIDRLNYQYKYFPDLVTFSGGDHDEK